MRHAGAQMWLSWLAAHAYLLLNTNGTTTKLESMAMRQDRDCSAEQQTCAAGLLGGRGTLSRRSWL